MNNGNFYRLNGLLSFRAKNKLELQKTSCENKDFCNVNVPSDVNMSSDDIRI